MWVLGIQTQIHLLAQVLLSTEATKEMEAQRNQVSYP